MTVWVFPHSLAVAEPVVTLTAPTHLLLSNRSETTEIMCNAFPSNSTIGSQDTTIYTFTWRHLNGGTLQNNSRISILFPSNSSSVLSLRSLSILDASIACDVVANTSLSDNILASPPVAVNESLRIMSK